jgi:hypothetical protein
VKCLARQVCRWLESAFEFWGKEMKLRALEDRELEGVWLGEVRKSGGEYPLSRTDPSFA